MGAVPPIRPVAGPAYYDFIASRGLPTQMAEVRCMEQGHGAVQRCRKSWQQKEGTAARQQKKRQQQGRAAAAGVVLPAPTAGPAFLPWCPSLLHI